jgi:hypothetical protein
MRWAALLALLALGSACKREPKKNEPAKKTAAPQDDNPAFLVGTWQKGNAQEWLVFDPTRGQVAIVSGKPATMKTRGKFKLAGRYLTLEFKKPNGSLDAIDLVVSPDQSRLTLEEGQGFYQRGSPPP